MSVLQVQNLAFGYPNLPNIFEGISFQICKGEFVGLIGANGSGKTSLIKSILGILRPTSGEVSLFDQKYEQFSSNPHNWAKVSYIPQTHSQPSNFPIKVNELLEISVINLNPKDPLTTKTQVQKTLEKLNITSLKNNELSELSGGQRQKVYIARAIINNPELVFLDEPTTGIDQLSEAEFYELVASLRREFGTAIVMISHDIGSISRRVDRIFCLDKTLQIIDDPKNYQNHHHVH